MTHLTTLALTLLIVFSSFAFLNDAPDTGLAGPALRQPTAAATPPSGENGASTPADLEPEPLQAARIDMAQAETQIRVRVLTPLRDTRIDLRSFSRARIPRSREVHYQIETPQDDRRVYVDFRVYESVKPIRGLPDGHTLESQMPNRLLVEGKVRPIARGRLDVRDGSIRLAPGPDEKPTGAAFLWLDQALTKMGVRPSARAR